MKSGIHRALYQSFTMLLAYFMIIAANYSSDWPQCSKSIYKEISLHQEEQVSELIQSKRNLRHIDGKEVLVHVSALLIRKWCLQMNLHLIPTILPVLLILTVLQIKCKMLVCSIWSVIKSFKFHGNIHTLCGQRKLSFHYSWKPHYFKENYSYHISSSSFDS